MRRSGRTAASSGVHILKYATNHNHRTGLILHCFVGQTFQPKVPVKFLNEKQPQIIAPLVVPGTLSVENLTQLNPLTILL